MYTNRLCWWAIALCWAFAMLSGINAQTPTPPSGPIVTGGINTTNLTPRQIADKRPHCAQFCYKTIVPDICPNGIYDFKCQCASSKNRNDLYYNLFSCIHHRCTPQETEIARGLSIKMCGNYLEANPPTKSSQLSTGGIVGIALGSAAAFFSFVADIIFCFLRRKRRKREAQKQAEIAELGVGEDKEAWRSATSSEGSYRFPRELHGEHRPHQMGGDSIYELPPGIDALHELPGVKSPAGRSGIATPTSPRSYYGDFTSRRVSI